MASSSEIDALYFTKGQSLSASGRKASLPGMIFRIV
jgi:hypothetical protein